MAKLIFQYAIDNKTPFVFFSCSGGQRMMESVIALTQMSRTVLAVNELKKNQDNRKVIKHQRPEARKRLKKVGLSKLRTRSILWVCQFCSSQPQEKLLALGHRNLKPKAFLGGGDQDKSQEGIAITHRLRSRVKSILKWNVGE